MANKTVKKKRESMIHIGLRIPRSLFERLTKRAERESARTGTVNVSAVARALLQEHA